MKYKLYVVFNKCCLLIKEMYYHLILGINKHTNNNILNILLGIDKYYYGYKMTYLYKREIIKVKYKNLPDKSNKYRYIVSEINTKVELKRVLDSGLNIFGLKFERMFNEKIDDLPNGLCILKFSTNNIFNQSINNLPKTLKILRLGEYFNQEINNLPEGLVKLILGENFKKSVDNLPKGLKYLRFGYNKAIFCTSYAPRSIYSIDYYSEFNGSIDKLPEGLKVLKLGTNFKGELRNLPKRLKYLHIGSRFNGNIENLPNGLTKLFIGSSFNGCIDSLPKSLRKIHFSYLSNFVNEMKILPEYLEVLILGTEYNNNIILPNSLKFIFFGRNYSKQIPKLPNNLKNVCFEYLNDANQICNLPESLEYLSIGGCDGIILNKNKIKIPKQIKLFEYAEYNNEYEISESTKTRNLDYYHTRYWEEKKMKN